MADSGWRSMSKQTQVWWLHTPKSEPEYCFASRPDPHNLLATVLPRQCMCSILASARPTTISAAVSGMVLRLWAPLLRMTMAMARMCLVRAAAYTCQVHDRLSCARGLNHYTVYQAYYASSCSTPSDIDSDRQLHSWCCYAGTVLGAVHGVAPSAILHPVKVSSMYCAQQRWGPAFAGYSCLMLFITDGFQCWPTCQLPSYSPSVTHAVCCAGDGRQRQWSVLEHHCRHPVVRPLEQQGWLMPAWPHVNTVQILISLP